MFDTPTPTLTEVKCPILAVDIIVHIFGKILIIERKYPPLGFALPGGHVDRGESLIDAARRELKEETSIEAEFTKQFHTYSAPTRDPRRHVVSTVFIANGNLSDKPVAADDAKEVHLMTKEEIMRNTDKFCFDHIDILNDYYLWVEYKKLPSYYI